MSLTYLEQLADQWKPGPITIERTLTPEPARAFAALLDQTDPFAASDDLPPLWHWFYFTPTDARADLGQDGHPTSGHFLPPIPDRRRMMAGGRLQVTAPMKLGATYQRTSEISSVVAKSGRSGDMLFVTVRHSFHEAGRILAVEEEGVVYRQQSAEASPRPIRSIANEEHEEEPSHRVSLMTDPVTLFRFSALTYNAHRIHYDYPYATNVERYPGLVVHGPLLALMMLEVPRRQAQPQPVRAFSYRLRSPIFEGQQIVVRSSRRSNSWDVSIGSADSPSTDGVVDLL